MKKIYKVVLILVVSSSFLFSSEIESLGIHLGKAKSPSVQKDQAGYIVVTDKPDDSFRAVEIYTVLKKIKDINMKPYISYSYNYNDEFKHNYILVGLNKYYKVSSYKLYVGVLSGYGYLTWKKNPINGVDNDTSTQSYIVGVQGGMNIPFSSKWSLDINTKYLRHEHLTTLQTSATTSEVEHYESMIVQLGFSYKF